jgi:hypothetical protein
MTSRNVIARHARQALPGHAITVRRDWDGYEIQADTDDSRLYFATSPDPDRHGRRSPLAKILGINKEDR